MRFEEASYTIVFVTLLFYKLFYSQDKYCFSIVSAMRLVVRFFTVLVAIIFPNWVCTTKMDNYFDLDWQLMTELKSYSEDLQNHISVLNR